jgi:phosphomannomutase
MKSKLIEMHNPRDAYIKRIKELINFKALKRSNIKFAVDIMHGTGNGYLDTLLDSAGIRCAAINKNRDVMFGGRDPEPTEKNLAELLNTVKKESCGLGLSMDVDADRFGIIDSNGTFITPNQVILILLYH